MRLAYVILAHRYPEQLGRLVSRLASGDGAAFFVHIDRKTDDAVFRQFQDRLTGVPGVRFIERSPCWWGHFNIVRAVLTGIRAAVESGVEFDYLALLSGQDYPIKSHEAVGEFLRHNAGREFMEAFALAKPNRWTGDR